MVLWQDRAPRFRPKLALADFLIPPPLNADEYIAKIVEITTSPVTIENLPDRDFGTGFQQAPDKLPMSSVLFDVGIVSNP